MVYRLSRCQHVNADNPNMVENGNEISVSPGQNDVQDNKIAFEPVTEEVPKMTKPKLPVKIAAPKANQVSGPPDPCSFICAPKSNSRSKKGYNKAMDSTGKGAKKKETAPAKKEKQPRRPQAKSAYMFFCSEQRDIIKGGVWPWCRAKHVMSAAGDERVR